MNEKNKIKDRDEGRRGVAILIVIAMLSTLMLMASAFSISMRLERKGAANYRHSVVARHLLWGALGLAMNDIDRDLDGGSGFKIAPDWVVFPSANSAGIPARVTTAESQYYIPGSIRDAVLTHNPKPEWIPIVGSDNAQIGRCAYLVANVSGLLDGNLAGGTNRAAGSSACELQPRDGMSWTDDAFRRRNEDHFRYESLSEMKRMNLDLYNVLGGDNNGFAHVFSCSTEGEFMDSGPDDVRDKISIGGTVADLEANATEIQAAFGRCGINLPSERAFLFGSLLDYIDEDCAVRMGTDMPNTEAIHMLNEVFFFFDRTVLGEMTFGAKLEFIYPYLSPRDNTFTYNAKLDIDYTVDGVAAAPVSLTVPDAGDPEPTTGYVEGSKSTKAQILFRPGLDGCMALPVSVSNAVVITSCELTVEVKNEAGDLVDKVTLKAKPGGAITVPAGVSLLQDWECLDPRYNWDQANWAEKGNSMTMGTRNSVTQLMLDSGSGLDFDDDTRRYCADSGKLRNVGELGNLPLSPDMGKGMFKTFKLYGNNVLTKDNSRVFEEFTVAEFDPNSNIGRNRRGLININSTSSNVWTSIFRNAPKGDPELDDASSLRMTDNEAKYLGGRIAADVKTHIESTDANKGPFRDVSAFMAELKLDTILNDTDFPGMTDFEREMLISSSVGMLTARQNTFVILLCGEKYVSFALKSNEGKSMASMFAVATVSRDPFRDPTTGKHKMFVRSFNVLGQ